MTDKKKQYDINFVKTQCKQYVLMLNRERDADIIAFLDRQTNRNAYLKQLIRKDKLTMRNEQLLQNYSPSMFKVCLSGKETNTFTITDRMRKKDFWLGLFQDAIEDLQMGCTINGKGEKNEVDYWKKQIRLLEEFEPK